MSYVGTSGCAHWFMLGVLFWSIIAGVSYVYQLVCCQSGSINLAVNAKLQVNKLNQ